MEQIEEQYQLLVENARSHYTCLLNTEGYIQTWDQKACQMNGYATQEVMGKHFSLLYPQKGLSGTQPTQTLTIAAQTGRYEEEGWLIRKDQRWFWARVVFTPIRNQSGKLTGFSKVVYDLSGQKTAEPPLPVPEQQPLAQVNLLSAMINNAPMGMVLFAPERNGLGEVIDFRCRLVNRAAAGILHRTVDELTGQLLRVVSPYIENRLIWEQLHHCQQSGDFQKHQGPCAGPGMDIWIDGTLTKQDEGVLWVFQEVTALKQDQLEQEKKFRELQLAKEQIEVDLSRLKLAEQEVVRAFEREHETNKLKTEFVKLVSHQFRTPMTSILLKAEFLKRSSERSSDEAFANRVVDYAQQVVQDIHRLDRLISKVLVHERMHLNQVQLQSERLDVVAFCENFILGQQQHDTAYLRVTFHRPRQRVWAEADPTLLEQVLENLISNALKYSNESEKPVEVTIAPNRKGCSISVKDYGIGIPAEEIRHLTKSFFRASNTNDYPGTGLGLSLSQRLVKMHSGELMIESEQNVYSLLTVLLPLRQPRQEVTLIVER